MFFIEESIRTFIKDFDEIPVARRSILGEIAAFISKQKSAQLVFICTHNSRRSHIAQIWAAAAAAYFDINNVKVYSGGTEATAFNPRAVSALRDLGFRIDATSNGSNPHYSVRFSDDHSPFEVYSKKYDVSENPSSGFAAVMVCSHADENCPIVNGAAVRISLPFDDPKDFDGTDLESIKYHERSLEIGREIFYAFSQIKKS